MSDAYVEDIPLAAYKIAWKALNSFACLSADELASAPSKLREYIDVLFSSGERDHEKIAKCALALIREYNQIARSAARVTASPSVAP